MASALLSALVSWLIHCLTCIIGAVSVTLAPMPNTPCPQHSATAWYRGVFSKTAAVASPGPAASNAESTSDHLVAAHTPCHASWYLDLSDAPNRTCAPHQQDEQDEPGSLHRRAHSLTQHSPPGPGVWLDTQASRAHCPHRIHTTHKLASRASGEHVASACSASKAPSPDPAPCSAASAASTTPVMSITPCAGGSPGLTWARKLLMPSCTRTNCSCSVAAASAAESPDAVAARRAKLTNLWCSGNEP